MTDSHVQEEGHTVAGHTPSTTSATRAPLPVYTNSRARALAGLDKLRASKIARTRRTDKRA